MPVLYSRLRDGALFLSAWKGQARPQRCSVRSLQTGRGDLKVTPTRVKVSLLKSGVKVEQVMGVVAKKGRATGIKAHAIESTGEVNARKTSYLP